MEPLASFIVVDKTITKTGLGLDTEIEITERSQVIDELQCMIDTFDIDNKDGVNGLFGYTNYDAVRYFDTLAIDAPKKAKHATPDMYYSLFRYIIQIDHFKNELLITENLVDGAESNIQEIVELVKNNNHPQYNFKLNGAEGTKESEIEDRKDKRVKLQATQQSKLINQRQNNSGPVDFENQSNIGVDLQQFMPKV